MSDFSTFFPSGGGGSSAVGSIDYLILDPLTGNFVNGQEVYNDPADSSVWLRSGAQLTGNGAGELNASIYAASKEVGHNTGDILDLTQTSVMSFYMNGYVYTMGRGASNTTCPFVSTNTSTRVSGTAVNYTSGLFDGNNTGTNGGSSTQITPDSPCGEGAETATHIIMGGNCNNIGGSGARWQSSAQEQGGTPGPTNRFVARYIPKSGLSQPATVTQFTNNTLRFLAPPAYVAKSSFNQYNVLIIAITNPGLTSERHWFAYSGVSNIATSPTSIKEYTFNSSTANGGEPWTATGNTLTLAGLGLTSITQIQGIGNSLYIWDSLGGKILEVNATTRTVIKSIALPGVAITNPEYLQLVVIPATETLSGNVEFWLQNLGTPANPDLTITQLTDQLTGPYTGSISTRAPITLNTSTASSTYDSLAIKYSESASGELVYLWQKIA